MSTCVRFRFAVIALLSLAALPVFGQTGNPSGGSPGSNSNRNTNTSGNTSSIPRTNPNPPQERQIYFVEGRVLLADGNPPPEPLPIERVCNGNPRAEAYTDSKGHFSFQLGQNLGSSSSWERTPAFCRTLPRVTLTPSDRVARRRRDKPRA